MKAEILSVGTELLLGDIVNTDAQFLARELARLGFTVLYHSTVGDNEERLSDLLQTALSRSDLVLTTGGLGPTADDLTKEVCAKVLGIPLVEDAESMRRMEAFFQARGQEMPETNRKQAFLPQGCVVFRNDHGTAPGCAVEQGGKIVINLPGPPRELKPMFLEQALPYLSRFAGGVIVSHTVRTFGIGESAMAERAAQFLAQENPTVAPYAKDGEALLRVTAKANSQAEADALCKPTVEALCALYGKLVYGVDVGSLQQAVVQMLRGRGLKIGLAESCTAGLIAKRITEIPGSSEVLECGIVSYSNRIKEEYIGRFMSLCSSYIDKLDGYRRMVYKMVSSGQIGELVKVTRSSKGLEAELNALYKNFDTAFLHLFPNFVTQFNSLLLEDEQVVLKRDELLNTELRIFALIRLGINDSSQIAEFLRYSVNTIYNYRAKVKNKACVSRDDFENLVRKIH